MHRRWLYVLIALVVVAVGIVTFVELRERHKQQQALVPPKPEAPPDLEKLRGAYDAGLDAIHRGDGREAVRQFSSFTFGKRAVDEYRLYYLANGYQLANDSQRARDVLASLWARKPKMIAWIDAGLNLGNLYASIQAIILDRKSTRLNSSHEWISYAVFCLKKKKHEKPLKNYTQKLYNNWSAE